MLCITALKMNCSLPLLFDKDREKNQKNNVVQWDNSFYHQKALLAKTIAEAIEKQPEKSLFCLL